VGVPILSYAIYASLTNGFGRSFKLAYQGETDNECNLDSVLIGADKVACDLQQFTSREI
jgi:hypothetical protein